MRKNLYRSYNDFVFEIKCPKCGMVDFAALEGGAFSIYIVRVKYMPEEIVLYCTGCRNEILRSALIDAPSILQFADAIMSLKVQ